MNEIQRRIIRAKSDAEIRQGGFMLQMRPVTREECRAEQERREHARSTAAKERERGDY